MFAERKHFGQFAHDSLIIWKTARLKEKGTGHTACVSCGLQLRSKSLRAAFMSFRYCCETVPEIDRYPPIHISKTP
jgi:hypothetical protein